MSLLMAIAMVLTLIQLPGGEKVFAAPESVKIYFELPSDTTADDWAVNAWGSGSINVSGGENVRIGGTWGDQEKPSLLSDKEGWGYVTISGTVSGLQFVKWIKDNGDTTTSPTVYGDCWNTQIAKGEYAEAYYSPTANKWYTSHEKTTEIVEEKITEFTNVKLYFLNSEKWTTPAINAWEKVTTEAGDSTPVTGWNGGTAPKMLQDSDSDWYYATLQAKEKGFIAGLQLIDANAGTVVALSAELLETINSKKTVEGADAISLYYAYGKIWESKESVVVPEEPKITTCNLTIHYKNAYGDNPSIYMYNGSDKVAGAWPGTYLVADEDHEGWYYAHLTVSAEKDYTVIFKGNNGQTTDLTGMVTTGKETAEYWYDASTSESFTDSLPEGWKYKTIVHYYAPEWNSANVYVWDGAESLSGTGVGKEWPGDPATPVKSASGNDGWFDATFYEDLKTPFKCRFNTDGAQTDDINVQVTSANTELWVSGVKGSTEVSAVAPDSWKGETPKPYKFMIYYCNPDLLDNDAESTTKDLWMWNAGLSESYKFTGTWYDEDNQVTWLTQEIEVGGQYVGKEVGLKARYDYTQGWQGGSDGERSFLLDKEAEIYYYLDGKNPTTKKPIIEKTAPRYVCFEYSNTSLPEDIVPCFYSWTIGGVSANKQIPMTKDSDGKWKVNVKVSAECEKVDFVVTLDTTGDSWIKDGGDHSVAFPLAQNTLYMKMNAGEEPVLNAPYNIGYEILPKDDTIKFFYRDDEKVMDNTIADLSVSVEVGKASHKMTYSSDNKRFEVSVPLMEGKILYRYKVGEEYVLDAFNSNKDTVNETEYSFVEYYKLDASVEASVMSNQFNYNENNVVKFVVKQDKSGANAADPDFVVTSASIDVSALGGSSNMVIEPELQAVTISATVDTALGKKTLPITVVDQFGNEFKTSVDVEVVARQKTAAADDFDWDEAIIYFMVTDRFFDGNSTNNAANGEATYGDNEGLYHGGDFAGVTAKLDYLQELGINTIWITPIVENIPGVTVSGTGKDDVPYNAAYHGYWASDFTKINPALGTTDEFATMIAEAHKRGIKIMVDIVVNHAGYGTEESFDKLLEGENMIRSAEETVSGSDQKDSLAGLPDFRTEDSDVRAMLVKWQTKWVEDFDIDFFRVDTVKHVEGTTWAALKNSLTEVDNDFKMIGEYAGGGYAGNGGTLGTGQMDSDLDFDFNDQASSFVNGNIATVEAFLTKRNQKLNNTYLTGQFLGSHDEDGFKYNLIKGGMAEDDANAAALVAASLQITAKGQPVIYYGEEIGLTGANNYPYQTNRYDFDWSKVSASNKTYQHYKKMLAIRNAYTDVFARGTRTTISASDTEGVDVFVREYKNEKLTIALNVSSAAKAAVVSGLAANTSYYDLYSERFYTSDVTGAVSVSIPAAADGGTVVLVKKDTPKDETPKEDTPEQVTPNNSNVSDTAKEEEKAPAANVTVIKNKDGSSKEIVKKTEANASGKEVKVTTTTKKDTKGKVISVTTTAKIEAAAKNTSVVVTVKKGSNGKVISAKAAVTKVSSSDKVSISGAVVNQIKEAAGTKTQITVKVTDEKGKTRYTVKADSNEIKANATLYVYRLNTKTGEYTAVNDKAYKVTDKGTVSVTMTKKATYELVTAEEAKAIDKKILATVKVKKSAASVKKGKTTTIAMSSKLNMDNVKSVSYKISDKKVATVSKSGKISAKKKGNVTVSATVTLNNGKTKTVKMKLTVK